MFRPSASASVPKNAEPEKVNADDEFGAMIKNVLRQNDFVTVATVLRGHHPWTVEQAQKLIDQLLASGRASADSLCHVAQYFKSDHRQEVFDRIDFSNLLPAEMCLALHLKDLISADQCRQAMALVLPDRIPAVAQSAL